MYIYSTSNLRYSVLRTPYQANHYQDYQDHQLPSYYLTLPTALSSVTYSFI